MATATDGRTMDHHHHQHQHKHEDNPKSDGRSTSNPLDAVRAAVLAQQQQLRDKQDATTATTTTTTTPTTKISPLPVTVLSGFLGAGKTTLLKHLLLNCDHGLKVAVIVNDMADLNIDASTLEGVIVQNHEDGEKMVSLSNGCICCTLREDLFVELAKLSTRRTQLDYVIIESSGISEPLPVAETFTFPDAHGTSLGDVAKLDALVTVVDGSTFLEELHVMDDLRSRGWEASDDDERTVAQLLCDQLEFANIIVMNKMDLLTSEGKERLRAILKRFNPTAQLIDSTWGRVDPTKILGTNLFDLSKAEQHPDWLKEARIGEHTPETVEYGISSLTFRSWRPFNVERFEQLTAAMETKLDLVGKTPTAHQDEMKENEVQAITTRVIRSKGLVWLASQQGHWQQGMASLAGQTFSMSYAGSWLAAINKHKPINESATEVHIPDGEKKEGENLTPSVWQEPWGDRRTELVVIGQDMDHAELLSALEACVVTDEEMEEYKESFLHTQPLDIIDETKVDGDLAEKIKQYKIEVLEPKKNKTHVLAETPKSTEAVSAHACITTYTGEDENRVARFEVQRYLRYAHLLPDLASGLVKVFALPLGSADRQTALLVDDTGGDILSETVSSLNFGDKVELEWLQIRVEYDTDVDQNRYRLIQQCQKLARLEAHEEKILIQKYPKPEIMIRKDQMTCSPNVGGTKPGTTSKTSDKKAGKKKGKKGKKNRR